MHNIVISAKAGVVGGEGDVGSIGGGGGGWLLLVMVVLVHERRLWGVSSC